MANENCFCSSDEVSREKIKHMIDAAPWEERQKIAIRHWKFQHLEEIKAEIEQDCAEMLGERKLDQEIFLEEMGFISFEEFKRRVEKI